ncbi:MAG: SAM-dependent methyltransferase [Candidatus Altiarchaeota archaeon]|nr:SAM-dependent methyltransferase [Candidatus Altiarchaeota archaeon]
MISIVYEVKAYRRLLAGIVREGDVVVELGPHTGKSTLSYIDKAKLAVVVDKGKQSEDFFKPLEERFPQLRFIRGDARIFPTVRRVMGFTRECDVLAVDLGGGRYPDTVFKVWAIWSGVFKPKNSVIRNRGLAEFLQRAEIADDSLRNSFKDDGWLSEWGRAMPYKLKKQLEEFKFWVDL